MDQVLEKGTAGPIVQEAVHPYAHVRGHESDVDDSSEEEEEEEEEERPVKKMKGPLSRMLDGYAASKAVISGLRQAGCV